VPITSNSDIKIPFFGSILQISFEDLD